MSNATVEAAATASRDSVVEINKGVLDDIIEQTKEKSKGLQQYAIVPKGMEEAQKYASFIYKSKWAPKDWNESDIFIAVAAGLELGIHPLQAIQGIAVINGKPSLYGDLLLAVVLRSGLVEEWYERPAKEALEKGEGYFRIKRRGNPHPIEVSFTKAQAVEAKLWGKTGANGQPTPWVLYPGRMLQMRARSWALRDGFADVLKGMTVVEEQRDIEKEAPTVAEILKTPQRKSEAAAQSSTETTKPKDTEFADAAKKMADKKDEAQKLVEGAPLQSPTEGTEGTGEFLITKVEQNEYKKTDRKTGMPTGQVGTWFKLLTVDPELAFTTYSSSEADVARTASAKKEPVVIAWKRAPKYKELVCKKLEPVIPVSSEPVPPEGDEPGSAG